MLEFVKLPPPDLDFAVISGSKRDILERLQKAAKSLASTGIYLKYRTELDGSFLAVLSSGMGLIAETGKGFFGLSGLARTADQFIYPYLAASPAEQNFNLHESGHFTRFETVGSRAHVTTDMLGMGQSFYSEHSSYSIVSNRLHLHKLALEALGQVTEPDPVAVTAALFSESRLFAEQASLSRTMIEGVRIVPVTDDIAVDKGRITFYPKVAYRQIFSYEPEDYEELIAGGVETIIENTAVALRSPLFETKVVELSGGKDSRMVFGAVTRCDGWQEHVRILTKENPGSDDAPIASGIVDLYGASFFEGDQTPLFPMTLEENLTFWRSYFFGQYNRFGAAGWSTRGQNRTSITLGGAIGEIYRRTSVPALRRDLLQSASSTKQFADSYVAALNRNPQWDGDLVALVAQEFADELDTYPGKDLEEKIEDHYLFNRNRTHFGMRGFTSYHERLTWFPLASRDLLAASRVLKFEERERGRVIYDVLERLDPKLLAIEFDGENQLENIYQNKPVRNYPIDKSLEPWRVAQESVSARTRDRQKGKSPAMRWADLQPYVLKHALEAINVLQDHSSLRHVLPSNLEQKLLDAFDSSDRHGYRYAMRIFAIHDVVT